MPFAPISAAKACIRRSRRLLDLANQNLPDSKVKNDLRRSAVVTVVSGIDAYMHWLVYKQISALRREGDLPKSFAKFDVPFTEMAALADAVIDARARQVSSLVLGCRSRMQCRSAFLRRPFSPTIKLPVRSPGLESKRHGSAYPRSWESNQTPLRHG